MFSQTYRLYDDAGVAKPNFVSKLRQYVAISSQFTIFSKKNNQNSKDFIKNNNFFFKLRRNYTGDKEFLLSLRKLDGTPANFFLNQVYINFVIRSQKIVEKEKCTTFYRLRILLSFRYSRPNTTFYIEPIFPGIGNSPTFDDFIIKYSPKKYFYRFRLLTVTLSTKILNVDDGDIIFSSVGLNDCKKADVNGKRTKVLGIINTENIPNRN